MINLNIQDRKLAEQLNNTVSPGKENRFTPNKSAKKKIPSGPMDAYLLSPLGNVTDVHKQSISSPFSKPDPQHNKSSVGAGKPVPPKANTSKSQSVADRCSSSGSNGSTNSIDAELNHFRPIRSAPKSPPKKLADGSLVLPKLIRSKAVAFSSGNIARFLDLHSEVVPAEPDKADSAADSFLDESQSLLATECPSRDDLGLICGIPAASNQKLSPESEPSDISNNGQTETDFDTQTILDILSQGGEKSKFFKS